MALFTSMLESVAASDLVDVFGSPSELDSIMALGNGNAFRRRNERNRTYSGWIL